MIDRIQQIEEAAAQAVDRAGSSEELERVRIEYLGRKAELPQLLRGVAQLPPEERGRVGKAANEARRGVEAALEARRAELDRSELETQVLEAQAAQAAAEAKLAQVKAGPRPEAVAQAQANLRAAQARLAALQNSRSSSSPEALQKRLDDARAKLSQLQAAQQPDAQAVAQADAVLTQARAKLTQLQSDPARQNDRAALDAARQDVQKAEAAAQAVRIPQGPSVAEVDQARRDVADAEQSLLLGRLSFTAFDADQAKALVDVADAQVKLVGTPASPEEVKAAETAAEHAFALAELARARVKEATLVAPSDGTVTKVSATVGSMVGPTGPVLTLIPPELQALVQVEEGQAPRLEVGQSVALSVDAFPNEAFSGSVKAVAPVLDPRSRTVAVKVEASDPQGKLRPGMFVQLQIKTGQRAGALTVPKEAIVRVPGVDAAAPTQTVVYQVVDNRVKRLRVVLGTADARNVEILQGLTEGVDVVLNPRSDLLDGELLSGS
jgi:RND family efflux transporter MFP subunit